MVAPVKKKTYVERIIAAAKAGLLTPKEGVHRLVVVHDWNCAIDQGVCTCEPELYVNGVRVKI